MKEETATQVERIERLLALLLIQNMKTASMAAKAKELSIAGFHVMSKSRTFWEPPPP